MKPIKLFIYSAGGTLLMAALTGFIIAAGSASVLALPEPVLGIPIRYAVLLISGLELLVAFICLFGRNQRVQLGWLAWLATNFMVYRFGLITMHVHPQATCIGSLTDPLHLARGITGTVLGLIPYYLLLGSYVALLWLGLAQIGQKARSRRSAVELLKMSCPGCGTHIKFASQNLGQKTQCPQCQTAITLRQPDLLKMTCFFCQEHIQFPSHSIGEKIPCPHCKMDITLKEPE